MHKTIFCKKNLIIFAFAAMVIVAALAVGSSFATYSHEANGSSTAKPRGEYFMDGSTFDYVEKNVDGSFSYNFYLTNVNENGATSGDVDVTIDFLVEFHEMFTSHIQKMSFELCVNGKWSTLDYMYTGSSAQFSDKIGFSPVQSTINYYRLNFVLDGAFQLKEHTKLFSVSYKVNDNTNILPPINVNDKDKQVDMIDFKGSKNNIYLGYIKEILANPNDFKVVVADIPSNMLIVNVHYYGTLCDTVNIYNHTVKEANTTYSMPYLIYAGAGYVPKPGYLTAGYTITVYRPANLPKGVEIFEGKRF